MPKHLQKRQNDPDEFDRRRNLIAPNHALTPEDWRFVEEYLRTGDTGLAATAAGLPAISGRGVLGRPKIAKAVRQAQSFRAGRTGINVDLVLRRWWVAATADPREIVEVWVPNCRHCWGADHRYQFTADELRQAQQLHLALQLKRPEAKRQPFDDLGGDGFRRDRRPNPDCTECSGLGDWERPICLIKDSRNFSEAARLLYRGIDVDRHGTVKVRMVDQAAIWKMLAQHLGMLVNRSINLDLDPTKLTDEQLDQVLARFGPDAGNEIGELIEHFPSGEDSAD